MSLSLRPAALPPAAPASVALLLLAACNGLFYHPSRGTHGDAAGKGYTFTDYTFASGSGNLLHGRLFPRREGLTRKGIWILFHGNSRNISGTYAAYAWVVDAGYDYFVFDYSGYGQSGGRAGREALHRDGVAALAFADSAFGPGPGERLVASGESLGGAVLLDAAAAWEGRARIDLLFVDSSFPAYRKQARAAMAERPYARPFRFLVGLLISDTHAPETALPALAGIPLLISHCREDEMIPFRMGEELFAAAPDPKRFWPLDACRHTQGFTDRFPENRARLLSLADSMMAADRSRQTDGG
jgi:fermentation-respiration switch protein FrsA (DUF1100 family)